MHAHIQQSCVFLLLVLFLSPFPFMSVTVDVCPHKRVYVNIQRKCVDCENKEPRFALKWTADVSSLFVAVPSSSSSSRERKSEDICCECDIPLGAAGASGNCVDIPLACECSIGRYRRAHTKCLTSERECDECLHAHTFPLQWNNASVLRRV